MDVRTSGMYSPSGLGGTFGFGCKLVYGENNLGRLRSLGAIDYPSPGKVALTRYVMP